ncbi:hypothetical protein AVEN_215342-1 [Araneus ventricosus]|uniref:Uncharacterized protein n=1 Tax=Araneus ventricosus TaxID=182803 RepID=A0A4Y2GG52_ARAVE|nr:hypothetical protein AVEN_215342-1 [Araneus ventricosus]
MTRTTPELSTPSPSPSPHQREDVWPPAYDLACNRPNTLRIFGGIGLRAWSPLAGKPRPDHWTTTDSGFFRRKSIELRMSFVDATSTSSLFRNECLRSANKLWNARPGRGRTSLFSPHWERNGFFGSDFRCCF